MLRKISKAIRRLANPAIIDCNDLIIGKNVIIEPGVTIKCNTLIIGDGVIIKSGTQIEMNYLIIGDYTKINNNCLLTGTKPCAIGHNCWIGHYSIIDSIGVTLIGNGVGIGAHSQLWTHIYFGDTLYGCRFASERPLIIHDDAWLVGHCIVNPVVINRRGMAMTGSVVTHDIPDNHIFAGVPAKDVTDTFGNQFDSRTISSMEESLALLFDDFYQKSHISKQNFKIVSEIDPSDSHATQFCVATREYTKHNTHNEAMLMRFLLPTRAKFNPYKSTDWISKFLQPVWNKYTKH